MDEMVEIDGERFLNVTPISATIGTKELVSLDNPSHRMTVTTEAFEAALENMDALPTVEPPAPWPDPGPTAGPPEHWPIDPDAPRVRYAQTPAATRHLVPVIIIIVGMLIGVALATAFIP